MADTSGARETARQEVRSDDIRMLTTVAMDYARLYADNRRRQFGEKNDGGPSNNHRPATVGMVLSRAPGASGRVSVCVCVCVSSAQRAIVAARQSIVSERGRPVMSRQAVTVAESPGWMRDEHPRSGRPGRLLHCFPAVEYDCKANVTREMGSVDRIRMSIEGR